MLRSLLLAIVTLFAAPLPAATLALWYTGNATFVTGPTSPNYNDLSAVNATSSAFFYAGLTPATGNDNAWTNWSTTGSPAAGKYLEYRLVLKTGYRATLTALTFGYASTSGNMTLTARSSADNYTADLATQPVIENLANAEWSIPLGNATVTSGGTYTVRIYGVAPSAGTRLANRTGGILSAEFLGTITDVRPPSVKTTGKTFVAKGSSLLLKGTAINTTTIQWTLNGAKKFRTLAVKGSAWKLRVTSLRLGKNTLSLVAVNAKTGRKSKPVKLTITRQF